MWTDYTEVTRCSLDGSLGSKYGLRESPLADTHMHSRADGAKETLENTN